MKSLVAAKFHSHAGVSSSGPAGRRPERRSRRLIVRLLALGAAGVLAVALMPAAAVAAPAQPNAAPAQPPAVAAPAQPDAAGAHPAIASAGDWTQFHNGPTHQGYNTAETILSASSVPYLALAWKGAVNPNDSDSGHRVIESSPAVANGVVYVGSRNDGKLFAYAVGCGTGGAICQPLWTANTDNWWIKSSPAVYTNGSSSQVIVGGSGGSLFAFDAAGITNCGSSPKTCTPLWTAATGAAITSSPTVYNGVVYLASENGKLYAFNPSICGTSGASCAPLWTSAAVGSVFHSSPAVAVATGGMYSGQPLVYVGADDGKLYVYSATGATGCSGGICSPLWTSTATGGAIWSSPAVSNSVVYVGSNDGHLRGFDADGVLDCSGGTCAEMWKIGPGGVNMESTPAVMNYAVYEGWGRNLAAPTWYATTGAHINSSPAVANEVVYVGSQDGKLYAFNAVGCGSGVCDALWTYTTDGAIESSPAVSNGVVYVGSDDGYLYAFDLPLDHLDLSPANTTIVAGAGPAYTAEGFDAYDNSLGDLTSATTFTIDGGGSCTGATCTSTVAGDHIVTGTDGSITGTATLHVAPGVLDHLVLNPVDAWTNSNGSMEYLAEGSDVYGNGLDDLTSATTFTISGGSCAGATCSSTVAGDHTVTGTDGSFTGTATLHVLAAALDHLVLSPSSATIAAGGSQAYSAQGADAHGNSLGDLTTSTTFTISGGSCTGASCTSTAAGDHIVTGTDGTATGTATLHVSAATLDHLVLSPASATITAGGSQAYSAQGFDASNNSLGDVTSGTTFTMSGGSCTGATCTSTLPGDHTVTGTDGSATGTATLHVSAAALDHLVLSPSDATIVAGASQAYTAQGFDASNNSLGDVTSATTFTISGGGSCTGATCTPTVAGDHTVTGTDGSATGTATLHVVFTGATFHAITPGRVLDSRIALGASVFRSRTKQSFQVTGLFGVPAGAVAVTGNVTVVGQVRGGYVTIAPALTSGTQPGTSTINFPLGDIRANGITVSLGAGGKLDAMYWSASAADTVNVLFDVTGFFAADATGATFHAIAPGRVLDSRSSTGAGTFRSRTKQSFQVTGLWGVPAGAVAVTGNVTIVGQVRAGYVTIAPSLTSGTQPGTSTINFPLGDIRANGITVALGAGGKLDAMYWSSSTADTVHVLFDVTGYFAADATGATFHAITPGRVLDSRIALGASVFHSRTKQSFAVTGLFGVPTGAVAVTGNVTVVGQTRGGYVTVAPSLTSGTQPGTSTINFPLGDIRANGITVSLGAGGKLDAMYWSASTADTTNVLFDVTGYFN